MADQSQTATNKQSEPARCKQGCGFFGNAATSGFCSKCWSDVQKTKSAVASAVVPPPTPEICRTIEAEGVVVANPAPSLVQAKVPVESSSATTAAMITPRSTTATATATATATPKSSAATKAKTITAMSSSSSSSSTETPANSESAPAPVANAPAKKKKKKKTSYKNMMASMMKETTKRDDDDDKAKKAIRKVTGGGAFSKIDKI